MSFDVNTIRSEVLYGGARPTLFDVQILNPRGGNFFGLEQTRFKIEAASIPEAAVGTIIMPYFGRQIKLAGDRVFQDWQVTVVNDETFDIRGALEQWSSQINSLRTNLRSTSMQRTLDYKAKALVRQYGRDGRILRTYEFNGLYPSNVGQIGLSWGAIDQIERFNTVFAYDWWEPASSDSGTGIVV